MQRSSLIYLRNPHIHLIGWGEEEEEEGKLGAGPRCPARGRQTSMARALASAVLRAPKTQFDSLPVLQLGKQRLGEFSQAALDPTDV